MPDQRHHRGAHPEDAELFSAAQQPALKSAVADLSWLLTRAYATPSALKLVGDRFNLSQRQRLAVMRAACSDQALADRRARMLPIADISGRTVLLDGYNVLTTIEAALSGGVVLACRDGCYRDMASIHGTYRKVEETPPALTLIGQTAAELAVAGCTWYLDSPVSNSGRLKALILDLAGQHGWKWNVEVVLNPDAVLSQSDGIIATADSVVLDRCGSWVNLAKEIVARRCAEAWVIDMR